MINRMVASEVLAKLRILASFVGHHALSFAMFALTIGMMVLFPSAIDMEATDLASSLDKRQDNILVGVAAPDFCALFVPNEGFVNLDNRAVAAHGIKGTGTKSLTDTVRHEPRGFQGYAENAVKLVRTHSFFGRAQQMDSLQPNPQGNVASLEDGSYLHGEGLAAFVALANANTGRFALHEPDARRIGIAAMRTDRTIRPNPRFDVGIGGVFVVKVLVGKDG
jgi:hypothetical protein